MSLRCEKCNRPIRRDNNRYGKFTHIEKQDNLECGIAEPKKLRLNQSQIDALDRWG